jgi:hypothetical protein
MVPLEDGLCHDLLPRFRILPAIGLEHRAIQWQYIAEHIAIVGEEFLHLLFPSLRLKQN